MKQGLVCWGKDPADFLDGPLRLEDVMEEGPGTLDFEEGKRLLAADEPLRALAAFERALAADGDNPVYQSYFALLNAAERGQARRSLELAALAVEKAPDRPDLYLNLGRLYLAAGDKEAAVEALRDACRLDPENEEIRRRLGRLGSRRKPIFESLSRGHVLNKTLGLVSYRLKLGERTNG